MAEEKLTKLEEELKCGVCFETYTNPKLLECYHLYCQRCLGKLMKRSQLGQHTIPCPLCRQVTLVPEKGVKSLPTAAHISSLVEILKLSHAVCYCSESEHSTREAELYCESCREFICWKCVSRCGGHLNHDYFELTSPSGKEYLKNMKFSLQEQMKEIDKVFKDSQKYLNKKTEHYSSQKVNLGKEFKRCRIVRNRTRLQFLGQQKQNVFKQLESLEPLKEQIGILVSKKASIQEKVKESEKTCSFGVQLTTLKVAKKLLDELQSSISKLHKKIAEIPEVEFADPLKCCAEGDGLRHATIKKTSSFSLRILTSKGQPCTSGDTSVKCKILARETELSYEINKVNFSLYEVSYKPLQYGLHNIHITVDGQEICGSPAYLVVTDPHNIVSERTDEVIVMDPHKMASRRIKEWIQLEKSFVLREPIDFSQVRAVTLPRRHAGACDKCPLLFIPLVVALGIVLSIAHAKFMRQVYYM